MKSWPRFFIAALAVLIIGSVWAASARASTGIQSITIQFTTLEEGKAAGAAVSAFIQNPAGQVVAGSYDFAKGPLVARSTSPEFPIAITHGPLTQDNLSGFKLTVQMQAPPGKTDSWQFNYTIKVHLTNGTAITRQATGCGLKSSSGGSAGVAREFHL